MRRVFINSVTPDMRLGRPIRGPRGELLLAAGVTITAGHLSLLRERGFLFLYVEDGHTNDIELRDILSHEVRAKTVRAIEKVQTFLARAAERMDISSLEATHRSLQGHTFALVTRKLQDLYDLSDAAAALVEEVVLPNTTLGLSIIWVHDDVTFGHSLGVAVTAVMIGKLLRMEHSDLCALATGAMLHDAGKVFIDRKVLDKPAKLSPDEMDQIREHPALGYEVLKQLYGPGVLFNHIPYQHHERQDGTGYPRGLFGTNQLAAARERRPAGQVLPMAEISAIADVYDALNSDRPYRPALPVEQILDILREMSGTALNSAMLGRFLDVVAPYPVGSEIVVHGGDIDGFKGVVLRQNRNDLLRPIVRLFHDAKGNLVPHFEVDLQAHSAIGIAPTIIIPPEAFAPSTRFDPKDLLLRLRRTAEREISHPLVC